MGAGVARVCLDAGGARFDADAAADAIGPIVHNDGVTDGIAECKASLHGEAAG